MKAKLILLLFIVIGAAVVLRLLLYTNRFRVTSWFRSPLHNATVGGKPWSFHLLGWAADVVPADQVTQKRLTRIFPFVLNEGDHIHVGWIR